jgi:hypothetical protein
LVSTTVARNLDEVIADLRHLLGPDGLDGGEDLPVGTKTSFRGMALVVLLAALEVQDAWEQLGDLIQAAGFN